ncbi:MAG: PAS domain S-box protein [Syntrophaceae bacterium]|nr:PAS domain S-box protein [Syntrophaceae bacterium]
MKKGNRSDPSERGRELPSRGRQVPGPAPEPPQREKAYTDWTEKDIPYLYENLRLHQVELEMRNEELRQSQAEMEELRKQYTDLYELAPVGYLTLDRRGTILRANRTAAHLLGMERSRLEGAHIRAFIAEADRTPFGIFLERVFADLEIQSFETRLQTPPHRTLNVHIEARRSGNDDEECLAVLTDITGQ